MRHLFLSLCLLASIVAAHAATFSTFDSRTDFRDESIYFIMTTRFFDGDNANNVHCWDWQTAGNAGDPEWRGDFKGLIDRLDYIKALGFTAIWMTPVVENASGYDYHGYHASNFSKVDYRYESHDASGKTTCSFKDVVDAAHARGMKIILDIVLNHTGNFGEGTLCPEFERDWKADQSKIDECMIPLTKSKGGQLPDNYLDLPGGQQYHARLALMKNTDGKNHDTHNYWHHFGQFNWDNATRWWGQIAGDCVDLNTENPATYNYLIKCYNAFIAMGVDGFRIDTSGHIARLAFNKAFIPAFTQAGATNAAARGKAGTPFYMFGEVCARANDVTYRNQVDMSPYYYTWKESKNYEWTDDPTSFDGIVAMEGDGCTTHVNHKSCWQQDKDDNHDRNSSTPTSNNAFMDGNAYRKVDYSKSSNFNVIDFTTHWNFCNADGAWNTMSEGNDKLYNDATWNVVYVDSHDYAPDCCQTTRYTGSQEQWAENMSLMFTFRGIPCVYYGSEIEFQKGKPIDVGPNAPLRTTGRAYMGGYLTGNVEASDFGKYTATGNVAQTLQHPLAQHLRRLNQIRQAVPALRKGQYSKSGCSGSFAFKRRYTDDKTDSYVLVCISGNGTFTGVENGTYVDCVSGDTKTVTDGKLSATCTGKGNLRVYVLNTTKTKAPGKVGEDNYYSYGSNRPGKQEPKWDGQENALTTDPTSGDNPEEPSKPKTPCLVDENEVCAFFTVPGDWGNNISTVNCYVWDKNDGNRQILGAWPGKAAKNLGGGVYKMSFTEQPTDGWMIIFNGSGKQTGDLVFANQTMYNGNNAEGLITAICEDEPQAVENITVTTDGYYYDILGRRYDYPTHDGIYIYNGQKIMVQH